jgi:thiol:disulfide interchange protein DsbA
MNRRLILLALLLTASMSACGRESAHRASSAAQTPAPASEKAPAASTAASGTAESSSTTTTTAEAEAAGSSDEPGTASLERLAAVAPQQQLPDGRWKAGVNYDPIVPSQPTNVGPGKIEVLEVFWYACPHCYALEPYLKSFRDTKPDYVEFVRVPIMWGPVHRAHARLFYTLEALGRKDLHAKVFDTIHLQHNLLVGNDEATTLTMQVEFAKTNGIDPEAFRKAYDSFTVATNLQRAEELMRRYQVESVPFLVVNGKYATDVGKAGSPENLIALINDLCAFEHHH